MKKLCLIAAFTLFFASFNSLSAQVDDEAPIVDSLLLYVMHDIFDSTLSIEDIKVEYRQLLDRIYTDASTNPIEGLRIGAKSLAIELLTLTFKGPYATHEDRVFTLDSLFPRFADIRDCWYNEGISYLEDSSRYCCLYQDMVRTSSNGLKTVTITVCLFDSINSLTCVTFPSDVTGAPYIAFTDENFKVLGRDHVLNIDDAYQVEHMEDGSVYLLFDESFVAQMLSHDGISAGYASSDELLPVEEQMVIIVGGLQHFHRQYAETIQLLNEYGTSVSK